LDMMEPFLRGRDFVWHYSCVDPSRFLTQPHSAKPSAITQQLGKNDRVVVLAIARGVNDCQWSVCCTLA
jgi:hypothetical protein